MTRLTPRELETLDRIAAGDSDKEMARKLKCAPRTATAHVQSIKSKLGARNRPNIVFKAIQAGILAVKAMLVVFAVFIADDDMRRGRRSRVRSQSQSGRASSRYEIHM